MSDEYDILEHGRMIGDRRRLNAYLQAIRRTVRPGAVVVDIGSGTGVFAVAACQAGAARVYAIEPSEIIEVALEIAAANGCASRIEFIGRASEEVTLPERADVIVVDVRGVLPDEQIAVVADARGRFLKETGAVVPARDTMWVAPLSAPELYEHHVGQWCRDNNGVDLGAVRDVARGRWYKCRVTSDQLLDAPLVFGTIEYLAVQSADVRGAATWVVREPATVHGFAAWFDSVLCEDVELSNRPGAPPLLYGNAFFPLREPIALHTGDALSVTLSGRAHGRSYGWEWNASAAPASASVSG